MNLPENDYQILQLTNDFYNAYPNPPYTEIMKKKGRAYTCLLFQTHYNYYICIPYRTEISHSNAYHFKKSLRSRKHKSGLDYSKNVIIEILACIEVLEPKSYDRPIAGRNDWNFVEYWRGEDGYNNEVVEKYFGEYL